MHAAAWRSDERHGWLVAIWQNTALNFDTCGKKGTFGFEPAQSVLAPTMTRIDHRDADRYHRSLFALPAKRALQLDPSVNTATGIARHAELTTISTTMTIGHN